MGPEPQCKRCSGQRDGVRNAPLGAGGAQGHAACLSWTWSLVLELQHGSTVKGPLLQESKVHSGCGSLRSLLPSPRCMCRGCGFSPADLPALQLPVEADGLPTPGSQPQVLQALLPAALAGLSLPLLWPSPGGPGAAPALCTAPPIQEQEPDPGPGLARSPAFPSHALPPFLHCLPEIPVGLPLLCRRHHTCPLLPPATTLCTAVSAACPRPVPS